MNFLIHSKYKFIIEIIFGLSFTFGVVLLFGSLYDTGDDLTMRNVSLNNSCELIWSKAVYGKILLFFPKYLFGFARYDFISFIIMGLSLVFILRVLSDFFNGSKKNVYFYYILVCLLYIQFLIRPQFTNTAGILAITGLLNIVVFLKDEKVSNLYIGLGCLLVSYWVRSEMTFVILFIGIPFLVFFAKKFRLKKNLMFIIPILIFSLSMVLTVNIEENTYSSGYHERMKYKRKVISPFFDYKFGSKLLKSSNEDILNASTLSKNDIYLFNAHYYDWPKFDTLLPYLEKVEKWYFAERDYTSSRLLSAQLSFKYFLEYEVLFSTLAIVFFLALNLGKLRFKLLFFVIISVLFSILVFGYYGYLQRAFLSRLYFTPLFGLIIFIICFLGNKATLLSKVVLSVLVSANFIYHTGLHNHRVDNARKTNLDWSNFRRNNTVISKELICWGGGPDQIHLNPVYLSGIRKSEVTLFGGVGYGGNPNNENTPVNRMLRGENVYYAIDSNNITLLQRFFDEKFSKNLNADLTDKKFSIYKIYLNKTK
jgi:hypothetical protein